MLALRSVIALLGERISVWLRRGRSARSRSSRKTRQIELGRQTSQKPWEGGGETRRVLAEKVGSAPSQ